MKTLYLYIKETPNGLKYLGTTCKNPFKYKGSGKYWVRFLNKYKFKIKDIKTTILFETTDKDILKEKGLYYSKLYNVVESESWANLIPESGDNSTIGYKPTIETIQKYLPKISHKVIRLSDKKVYDSVNQAAKENNLYSSHLRHRLKLNDKNIGFEYVNSTLNEKAILKMEKRHMNQNLRILKNIKKTSKYLGVSWDKGKNKWLSQITINNKKVFLGRFNNEEDAYIAYKKQLDILKTQPLT
jgi:hypothetical protein